MIASFSANTELQATNCWYIDGGRGVNVRNEPTTQGEVLFTLNSTDSVLVIDKNGPAETVSGRNLNWYKIKHNDLEGWVWSGFLKEGLRVRVLAPYYITVCISFKCNDNLCDYGQINKLSVGIWAAKSTAN
jgi:hypothetical protein